MGLPLVLPDRREHGCADPILPLPASHRHIAAHGTCMDVGRGSFIGSSLPTSGTRRDPILADIGLVGHLRSDPEQKIAIVGLRHFDRPEMVEAFVAALPADAVVISGGAQGVDAVAEEAAREHGLETRVFAADWDRRDGRPGQSQCPNRWGGG